MTKLTHSMHLVILAIILVCGVTAFLGLQGNTGAQLLVGIVTTITYVLWGFIHHSVKGDLHKKVVIEYVLIGAIAVFVLFIVLRQ